MIDETGMLALVGLGIAGGYGIWRAFAGRKESEATGYGLARWAKEEELAHWKKPRAMPPDTGSWMLGSSPWDDRVRLDLPWKQLCQHLLYIGPTGMGKTRLILPNLVHQTNVSMLVTDPDGEAWELTSGYHKNAIRYAPRDPDRSACFNWIGLCKDNWHFSQLVARAMVESDKGKNMEKVWRDAETALIAAIQCHLAYLEEATPAGIYDFLRHPTHAGVGYLEALAASPSEEARGIAVAFSQGDEKIRSSIVVPTSLSLSWLADKETRRFTGASLEPPDFPRMRRERTALYWCLPSVEINALRALTTVFWTIALHQLMRAAPGIPTMCVFDELANLGPLQDFEKNITLVRKLDLAFVMCLQSLSQLEEIYGTANAETIVENSLTKVVLAGLGYKTAELISKTLGGFTAVTPHQARSKRGLLGGDVSTTESESEHRRMLLYPEDIRTLPDDEQLIVSRNLWPIIGKRMWWDHAGRAATTSALGPGRTAYPMPDGPVKLKFNTGAKVFPRVPAKS